MERNGGWRERSEAPDFWWGEGGREGEQESKKLLKYWSFGHPPC